MSGDIPQWALTKADNMVEAAAKAHGRSIYGYQEALETLARYIAEHEEPPVDPLLIEAREIVATTQHNWPESPWHIEQAQALREGKQDRLLTVMAAYEGLKRGIELGQGK